MCKQVNKVSVSRQIYLNTLSLSWISLRDQSKDVDVGASPLNNRTEGQQTISHDMSDEQTIPSLVNWNKITVSYRKKEITIAYFVTVRR